MADDIAAGRSSYFIMDTSQAEAIINELVDGAPSGSFLVLSHPTTEVDAEPMIAAVRYWNEQGSAPMTLRTRSELLRFFDRLNLLEPGVVSCPRWRPDVMEIDEPAEVTHFCGVGQKP